MKKIAKYKFTPIKKIYVGKIMIMNQKKKEKSGDLIINNGKL